MNKIDLQGKSAVVTGAARGIGLAIAERLLESGARCSVWDIDREALTTALRHLSRRFPEGEVQSAVVDVRDAQSVKRAAEETGNRLGAVDILVNNAGVVGSTRKTWELSAGEWSEVMAVNLFGVFLCCQALVPTMIRRGYGRIVNISSVAGKEGNPNAAHYSASKAGVIALTKSLAKEVAKSGVIVNCVAPAVIETDVLKQVPKEQADYMLSKIPMGRFGLKEEAAGMVAWLCSAECSFSTGAVFDLSGGRATY